LIPIPLSFRYPNAEFITDAQWLKAHLKDEDLWSQTSEPTNILTTV
jgi:hypothetical protein